jgi:hypothetical protein
MLRCLIGGIIGGAIGVLAWVLIGYYAHYEIGWIAWGIGFLTGFGVRYADFQADSEGSVGKGVMAAALAVGAIVVAKYLVLLLLIGQAGAPIQDAIANAPMDDETMVKWLTNEAIGEMDKQGKPVPWPPGVTAETAEKKSDYPPDIWQQAETKWKDMGAEGQENYRRQRKEQLQILADTLMAEMRPNIIDTLSPWDALWFFLAVATAFKIGNGSDNSQ